HLGVGHGRERVTLREMGIAPEIDAVEDHARRDADLLETRREGEWLLRSRPCSDPGVDLVAGGDPSGARRPAWLRRKTRDARQGFPPGVAHDRDRHPPILAGRRIDAVR